MPAISNTSPILNLAIIGKLDLFRKQFGEIVILPGVFEELPGSHIIGEAVRSEWIKIQRVNDLPLIRLSWALLELHNLTREEKYRLGAERSIN